MDVITGEDTQAGPDVASAKFFSSGRMQKGSQGPGYLIKGLSR